MWFETRCIGAKDCIEVCPRGALELTPAGMRIDRATCDSCGKCQEACPAGAIEVVGREVSAAEAFDEVARDEVFYRNSDGGVTVSGGEPTLQADFVEELLMRCREAGIHTALDTCGLCPPGSLEGLIPSCDMALLDLKLMDPEAHRELAGAPLEPVLESARLIASKGKRLWVRTPVIPGCTDSEENIAAIGRFLERECSPERWDLLAFNNTCGKKYERLDMVWSLDGKPLLERAVMERLADVAGGSCPSTQVEWSGATRNDG
jgi:pyruvate formate lyase activating enzyme